MDSFKLFQSHSFKFLFSFSLFCVLFSLLPLLYHSLKPFLMQFFSYIIDKTYMFLLCNTLLAFIALFSSLINPSSSTTHESIEHVLDSEKSNQFQFHISESEITEPIDGDYIMGSTSHEEDEKEENSLMIVEQENVANEAEEDEEEEEEDNDLMIIDEDNVTEELNKKCEDFIKKMKATFFSDARAENCFYLEYYQNQKSLVLVN